MHYHPFTVTHPQGRLTFTTRLGSQRPWWRDLDLDGQPLYRIGNVCDTCESIFGRFDTAALPIAPSELSQRLRDGLDVVSPGLCDTMAHILPKGTYAVALLTIQPALIHLESRGPQQSSHYLWENSQPVLVPAERWPSVPRLTPWWFGQARSGARPGLQDNALYEAVLPLLDQAQLHPATIHSYQLAMRGGRTPTALALSVVDVRYPSGGRAFDWRLIHFLLDGHHKLMAASRLGRSMTILSFLNIDESFADREWIDQTVKLRYGEPSSSHDAG